MIHSLPILHELPKRTQSPVSMSVRSVTDAMIKAAMGLPDTHLVDSYGRVIRDVRISITDRCNFRCRYCMEPDIRFKRKIELLTDAEIIRLVRLVRDMGVRRIRLTGGEPMVHPTLAALIADLRALDLEDISMTTNGSLSSKADLQTLKEAGLDRITISLDSCREDRFAHITRSQSSVARVLQSVQWAREVGLHPVKINAVIIRGFNDDELPDLAALARTMGVFVRLIEYMPLDSGRRWDMSKVVSADEMLERISNIYPLVHIGRKRVNAPAMGYRFADGAPGRVGIIASVTKPFCNACSRLRITSDGCVMPCLFSTTEWDIRSLMRNGADDETISLALRAITWRKQAGHGINQADYQQPVRPMSAIGG